MQPTVPTWSWVSSWERRARGRVAEHARARERHAPRNSQHDNIAFYGWGKDGRHHYIRLDPLGKSILLSRQWGLPTSAPVTWRVDRFHDHDAWRVPDLKVFHDQNIQSFRPYEPVSIVLPDAPVGSRIPAGGVTGAGGAGGGAGGGWGHAARGWAAGAVVLALLVLIVRAAENCLHKKLFKAIYMHTNVGAGEMQREAMRGQFVYHLNGVRRQDSDEWSRPNVTATRNVAVTSLQHHTIEVGSLPRRDDTDTFTEPSRPSDLPPPYSECAQSNANLNKYVGEEPPPPYSACYVSYTAPKDGIPTVHIHTRRRQDVLDQQAHSSIEIDNVQNDLIENGLRIDARTLNQLEDNDNEMRTELVFDNGRIVERVALDVNSNNNTDVASNVNVEETRQVEDKDRVPYIDENISSNINTPERVLLV